MAKYDQSALDYVFSAAKPQHSGGIRTNSIPAGYDCAVFVVHNSLSCYGACIVSERPFAVARPELGQVLHAPEHIPGRYVFPIYREPAGPLHTVASPDLSNLRLEIPMVREKRYMSAGGYVAVSAGPFYCTSVDSSASCQASPFACVGGKLKWVAAMNFRKPGDVALIYSTSVEIRPISGESARLSATFAVMIKIQADAPRLHPNKPTIMPLVIHDVEWESRELLALDQVSGVASWDKFKNAVNLIAALPLRSRVPLAQKLSNKAPFIARLMYRYTDLFADPSLPAAPPAPSGASSLSPGASGPSTDDIAPIDATPAPSGATPAPIDAAPAPSDAPPAPSGATPAPSGATPAPSDAAPAPSGATPAPIDAAPAPSDATPAPSDATPAPSDAAKRPASAPAPGDAPPRKKKRT